MGGSIMEIKPPKLRFDHDFLPLESDFVVEAVAAPADEDGFTPPLPLFAGFVVIVALVVLSDILGTQSHRALPVRRGGRTIHLQDSRPTSIAAGAT